MDPRAASREVYYPGLTGAIRKKWSQVPPPRASANHKRGVPPLSASVNPTREFPPPDVYATFHPVQGEVLIAPRTGKVYTSAREEVPLQGYESGNPQNGWEKEVPILFSLRGSPGVRLTDVYGGDFAEIDERDSCPFGENFRGISIRIHFPGYPSSTEVERTLKKFGSGSGRSKARSMQVSTKNYKSPPGAVTKDKLAQEVSKRISWHIGDLVNNTELFPFDNSVGEKWRLGEGMMRFEHMTITGLENFSLGSWSPVIEIDRISP